MSRLQQEERIVLLSDLASMGSSGIAENENAATFRQTFYPVAEHSRAFDPDVALVVGSRGSGKSELFRAVVREKLLPAIARVSGGQLSRLMPQQIDWVAGHPLEREFPDMSGLRRYFSEHQSDPDASVDLWRAYLLRTLTGHLDLAGFRSRSLFESQGADVEAIVRNLGDLGNQPVLALDRLDQTLEGSQRWIIVSYDELDVIGGYDWHSMVQSIHGLISFWANNARRWKRIRPKIFLRTDLFRRHAQSFGADLIKLAANRAEITWSDRNLYGMLVKRLANASEDLRRYCEAARVRFEQDVDLALIPLIGKSPDARPLIERIAGQYMGANLKKGRTFAWLLTHIRDGNGHAMPRALVRLIEKAASQELERPLATYNRLLDPRSLRRALDDVSKEHVLEVNTHELPWLPGVKDRLEGSGVPMLRREAERLLSRGWDDSWNITQPCARPPANAATELVTQLTEIGVFRVRPDGRIDVPDLFMAGLGLSRKGGVRKR
ncbi:MAG: hypothetical protein HY235_04715 [Acidobacteria bacterium]|nr:hypothetical protein [Acidobacteriota bacterium]